MPNHFVSLSKIQSEPKEAIVLDETSETQCVEAEFEDTCTYKTQ